MPNARVMAQVIDYSAVSSLKRNVPVVSRIFSRSKYFLCVVFNASLGLKLSKGKKRDANSI